MELTAAIASLDPKNDAHWTENGLPRLDVIKELTGEHFSRKEVTDAAPLVTRDRLLAGESTEVANPSADKAEDPEVKVEVDKPDAPVEPKDELADVKVEMKRLEDEASMIDQKADALQVEITKLTNEHSDLIARRDGLLNKRDSIAPRVTTTHHIMDYLATQAKLREARPPHAGLSDLDRRLLTRARPPRHSKT